MTNKSTILQGRSAGKVQNIFIVLVLVVIVFVLVVVLESGGSWPQVPLTKDMPRGVTSYCSPITLLH